MKQRPLPRAWIQWRRYRHGALISLGCPRHLCWAIATAEAHARRRVARKIGIEAAKAAELTYRLSEGGDLRFCLTGPLKGLDDGQLERLTADAGISIPVY